MLFSQNTHTRTKIYNQTDNNTQVLSAHILWPVFRSLSFSLPTSSCNLSDRLPLKAASAAFFLESLCSPPLCTSACSRVPPPPCSDPPAPPPFIPFFATLPSPTLAPSPTPSPSCFSRACWLASSRARRLAELATPPPRRAHTHGPNWLCWERFSQLLAEQVGCDSIWRYEGV